MIVLLTTVFVASLLGSLHCVGMCGPFALIAGNTNDSSQSVYKLSAAYSFGRLMTYAIVGAIFGALGMALNKSAGFMSWQQTATYVAGVLMIAVGVIALARQLGWRVRLPSIGPRLQATLQTPFKRAVQLPPLRRAFLIGALSCLMPCGWLYTFAIVAAGTGSPALGALTMGVFWAGTVPIMVALMAGFQKLSHAVQQRIPVAMASLVILLGVFTIAYRAPIALGNDWEVVEQTDQLTEQVKQIDHEELPCCRP